MINMVTKEKPKYARYVHLFNIVSGEFEKMKKESTDAYERQKISVRYNYLKKKYIKEGLLTKDLKLTKSGKEYLNASIQDQMKKIAAARKFI